MYFYWFYPYLTKHFDFFLLSDILAPVGRPITSDSAHTQTDSPHPIIQSDPDLQSARFQGRNSTVLVQSAFFVVILALEAERDFGFKAV